MILRLKEKYLFLLGLHVESFEKLIARVLILQRILVQDLIRLGYCTPMKGIFCTGFSEHSKLFHKKLNRHQRLTKWPVAGEHVGEVWDDVECGIHDVSHGKINDEVICNRAHPSI